MQAPVHTDNTQQEEEYKNTARELDAIFNSSMSAVYSAEVIRNPEGKVYDLRFLRVNQQFLKLHSFTREQVINRRLLEISPRSVETGFINHINQVITTGQPVQNEMYFPYADAWYEFSIVKLDDNRICTTYNNITQQKRNLLHIENQKTLLDNILHYSASGISVTKAIRNEKGDVINWRTILANEAAAKFLGLPLEQLLALTTREIAPDLQDSPTARAAIETLKSAEPFIHQVYIPTLKIWIEITVSRLDSDHLINIFTNITEARESQLKLEELIAELKRSNASLEEFTRAASHDLKEPIRKIHFFVDMLKKQLSHALNTEQQQLFGRLENATERMRLLIDDLLEYSHASLSTVEKEEIDLNQKLKLVLDDLELPVKEKKAKVNIGNLPTIKGYRRQIQQLFQNLISNALKYSKQNVPPEITIHSTVVTGSSSGLKLPDQFLNQQFYCIQVSDNGIGFDQEHAERIFNAFTRLHGNSEYIGTGIGLSIVRKVVENHQGFIVAKSEPQKGSVFTILLPTQ